VKVLTNPIETMPAMKAYSIAVAPPSSFKKRRNSLIYPYSPKPMSDKRTLSPKWLLTPQVEADVNRRHLMNCIETLAVRMRNRLGGLLENKI
jgi:hypothetical protein